LTESALPALGADWAVYSEIALQDRNASEFATGYSVIEVICVARNEYGQVYTFYLANDLTAIQDLVIKDPNNLFTGALKFTAKKP